jgi:hypothetical protein
MITFLLALDEEKYLATEIGKIYWKSFNLLFKFRQTKIINIMQFCFWQTKAQKLFGDF